MVLLCIYRKIKVLLGIIALIVLLLTYSTSALSNSDNNTSYFLNDTIEITYSPYIEDSGLINSAIAEIIEPDNSSFELILEKDKYQFITNFTASKSGTYKIILYIQNDDNKTSIMKKITVFDHENSEVLLQSTENSSNVSLQELSILFTSTASSDPDSDADGDGLNLSQEQFYGTNPDLADTDEDGINDWDEIFVYDTNPSRESTDGDKYDDGQEIFGHSPANLGTMGGDMPWYVIYPGNNVFVAAYPEINIDISDSISIVNIQEITYETRNSTISSQGYSTSTTEGTMQTVGTSETHTKNSWVDVNNKEADINTQKSHFETITNTEENYFKEYTEGKSTEIEIGSSLSSTVGAKVGVGYSLTGPSVDAEVSTSVTSEISSSLKNTIERGEKESEFKGTSVTQKEGGEEVNMRIRETSTSKGAGEESSLTTSFSRTSYHETTVTNSHSIATGYEWGTATTTNTGHAADLIFTYYIENTGTDIALEVDDIAFNIFIGDEEIPITYFASTDMNGPINNLKPNDLIQFSSIQGSVPLTLQQLRKIDEGAPIRIILADYSYGLDELWYENAWGGGVLFEIDDGISDGDETIDKYMIPVGNEDKYVNVLAKVLPVTIINNSLFSINNQAITEWSWWDIYLQKPSLETKFLNENTVAKTRVFFKYHQDSDHDFFTDRTEIGLGTDPFDNTSYPSPELSAGAFFEHDSENTTITLKLSNTGNYDAFGIEARLFSPDNSTTIFKEMIGGGGRIKPGQSFIPNNDVFVFTNNTINHIEPLIILSYNDPQGHYNFITPIRLNNLNETVDQYSEIMIYEPKLTIETSYEYTFDSPNSIIINFDNPTREIIKKARMYIVFQNETGTLINETNITVDLYPGKNSIINWWTPSNNIENDRIDEKIKVVSAITDYQGILLDEDIEKIKIINFSLAQPEITVSPRKWGMIEYPTDFPEYSIMNTGLVALRFMIEGDPAQLPNMPFLSGNLTEMTEVQTGSSYIVKMSTLLNEPIKIYSNDPVHPVIELSPESQINPFPIKTINAFSDGSIDINLNFSDSSDEPVWFKIPKKAEVLASSLNMSGDGERVSANYTPNAANWNYLNYSFLRHNWQNDQTYQFISNYEINYSVPYDTDNITDVIDTWVPMQGIHHFRNLIIEAGAGISVGSYPNSLKLIVDDTLIINGIISADGSGGIYCDMNNYNGNPGGTITISANIIQGTGLISANGGNAAAECLSKPLGHGGMGGKIVINNGTEANINSISSNGGSGTNRAYYSNGYSSASDGGSGGSIEIFNWDNFNPNSLSVSGGVGGNGYGDGADGGNAGNITVSKINDFSINSIYLTGGEGGDSTTSDNGYAGEGGNGGVLNFSKMNSINFNSINLNGANGGSHNNYAPTSFPGRGGSAGKINFDEWTGKVQGDTIIAKGGIGGYGQYGGEGGRGGTIELDNNILDLNNLQVDGGNGGNSMEIDENRAGYGGSAGTITFGSFISNIDISAIQANAGDAGLSGRSSGCPGGGTIITFGDYITSIKIDDITMNGGDASTSNSYAACSGSSGGSLYFGKSIYNIEIHQITANGGNGAYGGSKDINTWWPGGNGGNGGNIILDDSIFEAKFDIISLNGGNGGQGAYDHPGNKGRGGTFTSQLYIQNLTVIIEAIEGNQYLGDYFGGKINLNPNSSINLAANTNTGNITAIEALSFETLGSLIGSLNVTTGEIGIYHSVNAEVARINYTNELSNNNFNNIISDNKEINNSLECDFCWYFPTNPYLDSGDNNIIDSIFLGWLTPTNEPQNMDLNASAINKYLENCTPDSNGYCEVPIIVHLDTAGKLELSNLSIDYISIPDLTLESSNIDISNLSPLEEEDVTIITTIRNMGEADVNNVLVSFFDGENGILLGHKAITGIISSNGGSIETQFIWKATTEGQHDIFVKIDNTDLINETDESNNIASKSIMVRPLADIIPKSIAVSLDDNLLSAIIENNGTFVNNVLVSFYTINPDLNRTLIGNDTISIDTKNNTMAQVPWNGPIGEHSIYVIVDPLNQIKESNEYNNYLFKIITNYIHDISIDCGGTNDPEYDESHVYGHLDGIAYTGWGTDPNKSVRYDIDGEIQYFFTYLDPFKHYHLDAVFFEGDGAARVEEIWINGQFTGTRIALNSTPVVVSTDVPEGHYEDGNITVSIQRNGSGDVAVSEIRLVEAERIYIDSGNPDSDVEYDLSTGYGYLDGYPSSGWGSQPFETVRYDLDGDVNYRFDGLDPDKKYQIKVTLFENDTVGRIEELWINDAPTGINVDLIDGNPHIITYLIPQQDIQSGTIFFTIKRVGGGNTVVSEIELEEITADSIVQDIPSPSFDTLIFKEKSWNFVSVPKNLDNDSVHVAFSDLINDPINKIWFYNTSTGSWEQPLKIQPLYGYWVFNNASTQIQQKLEFKDNAGPTMPPSILLKAGWNQIGHSSVESMPVTSALISIQGKYSQLLTYNPDTDWRYYVVGDEMNQQFNTLEPGKGYWIFMMEDAMYAAIS